MRRSGLLSLIALLLGCALGRCQAPPPAPAPWDAPPVLAAPPPVPAPPPDSALSPWSVDVMFGLPTGVRLQYALHEADSRAILVEGFVGLETILPIVGVGLRERFTPLEGERHLMTLSPGVAAYGVYNIFHDSGGWFGGGPTWYPMGALDVDIAWQRRFGKDYAGMIGLKLGAGVIRGDENWSVIPVVALFGGWRF